MGKRKCLDICQSATIQPIGGSEASPQSEKQNMLVVELKCQLAKEREERHRLEQMLVKVKTQYGEVLQLKDGADVVMAFYEEQLQNLVPGFEPINLESFQGWIHRDLDEDSISTDSDFRNFSGCGTVSKFRSAFSNVRRAMVRKNKKRADMSSPGYQEKMKENVEPGSIEDSETPPPRPKARWEYRQE